MSKEKLSNTKKDLGGPVVVNIYRWKPEGVEAAKRIAAEYHLTLSFGTEKYGKAPTEYPVIIIDGSIDKRGLSPFWAALKDAVPNYWDKEA